MSDAGRVRVTTSPRRAQVSIDGQSLGRAPVELELALGGHTLEVTASGYRPYRSELSIAAGQDRILQVVLERPPSSTAPLHRQWWVWTLLAAAATAVAVAGTTLAVSGTDREPPILGNVSPGFQVVAP